MPQSLNFAWGPRADGTFLKAPLQHLVSRGRVARVPFVTGNEAVKSSAFLVDQPTRLLQVIATTKGLFLA